MFSHDTHQYHKKKVKKRQGVWKNKMFARANISIFYDNFCIIMCPPNTLNLFLPMFHYNVNYLSLSLSPFERHYKSFLCYIYNIQLIGHLKSTSFKFTFLNTWTNVDMFLVQKKKWKVQLICMWSNLSFTYY
jgi:hypothetical protein